MGEEVEGEEAQGAVVGSPEPPVSSPSRQAPAQRPACACAQMMALLHMVVDGLPPPPDFTHGDVGLRLPMVHVSAEPGVRCHRAGWLRMLGAMAASGMPEREAEQQAQQGRASVAEAETEAEQDPHSMPERAVGGRASPGLPAHQPDTEQATPPGLIPAMLDVYRGFLLSANLWGANMPVCIDAFLRTCDVYTCTCVCVSCVYDARMFIFMNVQKYRGGCWHAACSLLALVAGSLL